MTNTQATTPDLGELKPCPKCGKRAFLEVNNSVWCIQDRCVRMPAYKTQAEAISAWNTRLSRPVGDDAQADRNDELLIGLLLREGRHSGVWFADKLLEAAERLAAFSSIPVSTEPSVDAVERVARAIHEWLSKRDIMAYLDNPEDCEGLIRAALSALPTASEPKQGFCNKCGYSGPVGKHGTHLRSKDGEECHYSAATLPATEASGEVVQADRDRAKELLLGPRVGGGDGSTYVVNTPTMAQAYEAFRDHRLAHSGVGNVVASELELAEKLVRAKREGSREESQYRLNEMRSMIRQGGDSWGVADWDDVRDYVFNASKARTALATAPEEGK